MGVVPVCRHVHVGVVPMCRHVLVANDVEIYNWATLLCSASVYDNDVGIVS